MPSAPPLLTGLANAWIVNEPLAKADAILVLGGGLETRPFAAAALYQLSTNNYPHCKVLLTQPELPLTARMGLTVPEFVIARQVLLSNGVPPTAIQMIGTNVTSTRDEAVAARAWLVTHHASRIIIPTDLLHTRRARWIFQQALRNTGAEVHVTAVELPRYSASNWWSHEEGLIAFQNEVVKSVYYHLRY